MPWALAPAGLALNLKQCQVRSSPPGPCFRGRLEGETDAPLVQVTGGEQSREPVWTAVLQSRFGEI